LPEGVGIKARGELFVACKQDRNEKEFSFNDLGIERVVAFPLQLRAVLIYPSENC